MLVIQSPSISTRPGLQKLRRDPLLSGDNDGVRFLFDAAFPWCYAGGAPANGALVRDIAEKADGQFVLSSGQTVGFSGNGFDFSTLTIAENAVGDENHVKAPASVWADIAAQQYFLFCIYVKMPVESDFNTSSGIYPFFASSNSDAGFQSVADPLTVAQRYQSGLKRIDFRRQTGINAASQLTVDPTNHYGKFCQIAYWRNASGAGARVKSSGGTTSTTGAVGDNNSENISACEPRFGSVAPFTFYAGEAHRKARNYRLYRGFIENLARSGRDPQAVLDADYDRTVARGVFT